MKKITVSLSEGHAEKTITELIRERLIAAKFDLSRPLQTKIDKSKNEYIVTQED